MARMHARLWKFTLTCVHSYLADSVSSKHRNLSSVARQLPDSGLTAAHAAGPVDSDAVTELAEEAGLNSVAYGAALCKVADLNTALDAQATLCRWAACSRSSTLTMIKFVDLQVSGQDPVSLTARPHRMPGQSACQANGIRHAQHGAGQST